MNDFEFIAFMSGIIFGGVVLLYFIFMCIKCIFDTTCPKPKTTQITNVLQIRVTENPLQNNDEDPVNHI